MTAERQRKIGVAPHKVAWTAIATSAVLHAVGFAAIATWSTSSTSSHVWFAGREQAFQLTLSIAEPQWNEDPVTLEDFEVDPPVVIEPNKARIGKHTYVHAPTVELSADDFAVDSAIDSTPPWAKLATLDEVHSVVDLTVPRTPTIERPPTNSPTSNSAVAVLQSSLASPLGNSEDIPPDLSQNAPPTYPTHAIQRGWEGIVLLRVWINEVGQVTKVEVARTSGYRILDGAAAAAVRQWNAIPANRGGKPITTIELLPVRFKL